MAGNRQLTYIGHLNQEATKVDGFEEKGSFVQTILYESTLDTIELLINQSEKCSQRLQYECKQSRLFDSKVSTTVQMEGGTLFIRIKTCSILWHIKS